MHFFTCAWKKRKLSVKTVISYQLSVIGEDSYQLSVISKDSEKKIINFQRKTEN